MCMQNLNQHWSFTPTLPGVPNLPGPNLPWQQKVWWDTICRHIVRGPICLEPDDPMGTSQEVAHLEHLHLLLLLGVILTDLRVCKSRRWRLLNKPWHSLCDCHEVWADILVLLHVGGLDLRLARRRHLVEELQLGEDKDALGEEAGAMETNLAIKK